MKRMEALILAADFVQPIIDEYELADYTTGGNILVPGAKMTKVDQHLDQIIRVAEWLLEGEGNNGTSTNVSRTAS